MDFQRLEKGQLSVEEKKHLITHPGFFLAPKSNDIIKRQHSEIIDRLLGFRIKYIEEMLIADAQGFDPEGTHETWGPSLHAGIQTWVGLDNQTLQTPYSECLRILQLLKIRPYQHIVDLGAAYGRMGVIVGSLFIKNSFVGYEYVRARVDEGNKVYRELDFSRCSLVSQDLFDPNFALPEADVYFIYDFGQVEHIDHTLRQMKKISQKRPIKVVVRGKYTKRLILDFHPWLELRFEGKHDELFSIYTAYMDL
jgi:hypothetical protein